MPGQSALRDGLLPYLDRDRIVACYRASPGNEIDSGKFDSPESSAALAANTLGYFLRQPNDFPDIPGVDLARPILSIELERTLRFPWTGGRHPWLDAVVETGTQLIGIESKRYEPFRPKAPPVMSEAYWRPVWGTGMGGYEGVRDAIRAGTTTFRHLDAAQLVKHSLGLLTQSGGRQPILVYLYAEPRSRPDGRAIPEEALRAHKAEIDRFSEMVHGNAVAFVALSCFRLLDAMEASGSSGVRDHGRTIREVFHPT
jgi:hypothetical protein